MKMPGNERPIGKAPCRRQGCGSEAWLRGVVDRAQVGPGQAQGLGERHPTRL